MNSTLSLWCTRISQCTERLNGSARRLQAKDMGIWVGFERLRLLPSFLEACVVAMAGFMPCSAEAARDYDVFQVGTGVCTNVVESSTANTLTLTVSGTGLQPAGDSVVLIGRQVSGDGVVKWKRDTLSGIQPNSVWGIMIRASAAPDSAFIFIGYERLGSTSVTKTFMVARTATGSPAIERRDFMQSATAWFSDMRLEWRGNRCFAVGVYSGADKRNFGIDLCPEGEVATPIVGMAFSNAMSQLFTVWGDEAKFQIDSLDGQSHWQSLIEPCHLDKDDKLEVAPSWGRGSMMNYDIYGFQDSVSPEPMTVGGVTAWEPASAEPGFSGADLERLGTLGTKRTAAMNFEWLQRPGTEATHVYTRWCKQPGTGSIKVALSGAGSTASKTVAVATEGNLWYWVGTLPAILPQNTVFGQFGASSPQIAGAIGCTWTWPLSTTTPAAAQVNLDGMLLLAATPLDDANQNAVDDGWEAEFANQIAQSTGLQVSQISSLPFLAAWADYDGDGLTNLDEYLTGRDPLGSYDGISGASPSFGRVSAPSGMSEPAPVPYHAWSRAPFAAEVFYGDGSGRKIPGYPVRFSSSMDGSYSPYVWGGFSNVLGGETSGTLLTASGPDGVAAAWLYAGSERANVNSYLTPTVTVSDFHSSSGGDVWHLEAYTNHSPGPIDLTPAAWTMSSVPDGSAPSSGNSCAIIGPWMLTAASHSAVPGLPGASGYVNVSRWDPSTANYISYGKLVPQAPVTNGRFGFVLAADPASGLVAVSEYGASRVYLYQFNTGSEMFPTEPVEEFTGTSWPGVLAVCATGLAVGNVGTPHGSVKVFNRGNPADPWASPPQTLTPTSGAFNDHFGVSMIFAPDGNSLLLGAPGDPGYFFDPNNAGYEGYYWETQSIWVGTDENGNDIYEDQEVEVWGWIQNDPPANPATYAFSRSSNGVWTQDQVLQSPEPMRAFGASLAVSEDGSDLYVGAPALNDPNNPWNQTVGAVYHFTKSGSSWASAGYDARGNPNYGESLAISKSTLFASANEWTDMWNWENYYPPFVQTLPLTASGMPSRTINLLSGQSISSMVVDDQALFIATPGAVKWHEWRALVPYNTAAGADVAAIDVFDEDSGNANAEEVVGLSLLGSGNGRFSLAPTATGGVMLTVAPETSLAAVQGEDIPVVIQAEDGARSIYRERQFLHVSGPIPETPSIESVSLIGPQASQLTWQIQGDGVARSFIVQRASFEDYENANANGTTEDVDALFSDVAVVAPYLRKYSDPLGLFSGSIGVTYRMRAVNAEGDSGFSNVMTVVFDYDEDGIPDWWEAMHGADLNSTSDTDNDGILDIDEFAYGTDPTKADSDGDGVDDQYDSSPRDRNFNGLGLIVNTALEGF